MANSKTLLNIEPEIVINLDRILRGDVVSYPFKELIHQEQINRVYNILKERVALADGYNPGKENDYKHLNDVISIFARRGAGKTTFVESLVNLIRHGNEERFISLGRDVYCLDVLDPNHIEKKENLTIRFISHIHEVFRKYASNDWHYLRDDSYYECNDDGFQSKVRTFEEASQKLYEALPVIDGIGNPSLYSEWDDTGYVAERDMELAIRIKELEKRFHRYISAGLALMNKKALLFVLDDCDIKIHQTFEILEIIRLYFTTPQLIVMMTGDAILYGMAIRKKYWSFFEQEFLNKEGLLDDRKQKYSDYREMVYRLETQYFQKMIKPEHRIFLNNLYDKISDKKRHEGGTTDLIGVQIQNSQVVSIETLYERIFALSGVTQKNPVVFNSYLQHFLAQPFRNQIRLFSIYSAAINSNLDLDTTSDTFVSGVLKVFEVYINQHSGDSKFLMGHTPIYSVWLLKFLVENNILPTGNSLLPEMEDDSLKNAIIALGFSFANQMKYDKSMIFDYWLRISLTHRWLELINEEKNADSFIQHSHLYTDWGATKILGRMTSYTNQATLSLTEGRKLVKTPGLIRTKKVLIGHTHSLSEELVHLLQLRSLSSKGNLTNIFSVFKVFAFLGEMLRLDSENLNSGVELDTFWNQFKKCTQIRSYIEAKSEIVKESDRYSYNIDTLDIWPTVVYYSKDEKENNEKNPMIRFGAAMVRWKDLFDAITDNVAPYWLDHVFSRFFHSLYNDKMHTMSLGDQISTSILAFWNALIVEGFIDAGKAARVNLDHTGRIEQSFFSNFLVFLNSGYVLDNEKIISAFLLCPLLQQYVNPQILALMIIASKKENLEVGNTRHISTLFEQNSQKYFNIEDSKLSNIFTQDELMNFLFIVMNNSLLFQISLMEDSINKLNGVKRRLYNYKLSYDKLQEKNKLKSKIEEILLLHDDKEGNLNSLLMALDTVEEELTALQKTLNGYDDLIKDIGEYEQLWKEVLDSLKWHKSTLAKIKDEQKILKQHTFNDKNYLEVVVKFINKFNYDLKGDAVYSLLNAYSSYLI